MDRSVRNDCESEGNQFENSDDSSDNDSNYSGAQSGHLTKIQVRCTFNLLNCEARQVSGDIA